MTKENTKKHAPLTEAHSHKKVHEHLVAKGFVPVHHKKELEGAALLGAWFVSLKIFAGQVRDFAVKKPVLFAGIVVLSFVFLAWLISSLTALEILPEARERQAVSKPLVLEKGDSLIWIGMEVAPVDRTIRKEFKIPGNIKGMFVIDEGLQLAMKYGVKTADVIVSINRKSVATGKEFINVGSNIQYSEGILLDIYRNGNRFYLTIPFEYQYGPLMGPNRGGWQLGSPAAGKAFQYGPIFR